MLRLRSVWVLLFLLALLASCLSQPIWSGYGGYPPGWGSAPTALPMEVPWHMQRPYYQQHLAMGGVYSPTNTQYVTYYIPYMANSIV